MRIAPLTCIVVLFLSTISFASSDDEQKRIVLTFDDLVTGGPDRGLARAQEANQKLLTALQKYEVPAIGFVNESKLYINDELEQRSEILKDWLESGMELGNHTYSHPSLNRISVEEYIADFERGEKVTGQLLASRNEKMRYFRHPFLHSGNSLEKKQKFEAYLAKRGYSVAPVTIDNYDYIYAVIYSDAKSKGDTGTMQRIGTAYINYMEKMTLFYERASEHMFSRQIPQTLLLHSNEINADYLDELIEMLIKHGYRFVSLADALTDPAYKSADTYTGQAGPSWLFRWDFTRGRSFDWRAEPLVDEWVMEAYRSRGSGY